MPKTSRRRRSGGRRKNFIAIPFTTGLALSTLADGVVLQAAVVSPGEDLFIISVDASWVLRDLTAGEGPIRVGFSHGDLTVSEVKEALEAEVSDPDDIIARERARRPVRQVGMFHGLAADDSLNNGVNIRTKVKFSVGDGHTFDLFAQNRSGVANLATGANLICDGVIYGRWQR